MRSMTLLAVLTFGTAAFADEKADAWKALKGTYTVEKAVLFGEENEDLKAAVLTLTDGKYEVDFGGQVSKGTIALGLDKKPKTMDIEELEGANKGKMIVAIYELDGDTLKVCYSLEGKDRPKAFESKKDTQTLYVVYKRKK